MAAQSGSANFAGTGAVSARIGLAAQSRLAAFTGASSVVARIGLRFSFAGFLSGSGVVAALSSKRTSIAAILLGTSAVNAIWTPPGPVLSPLLPTPTPTSHSIPKGDRHIRRSGDDYTQSFLSLLPQGQAWPREPGSTLVRACDGLSQYWGFVDGRAADLLERESDPRKTFELLPDWERAWGLPDPCFPSATTLAERQRMLIRYMTWLGGQSRQYFIDLMAWLGYTIGIQEFAPFMCGISRVGDTRSREDSAAGKHFRWYIGPPEQRFYWTIEVGQVGLNWFRAASSQAGIHHHLEFAIPEEAACLLQRWKPAHTSLIPDFSALAYGGPLQGTP